MHWTRPARPPLWQEWFHPACAATETKLQSAIRRPFPGYSFRAGKMVTVDGSVRVGGSMRAVHTRMRIRSLS